MTTSAIVSIIFILGALVLAVRGLRGDQMGARRVAGMAAVWVAIIAGLTIVLANVLG